MDDDTFFLFLDLFIREIFSLISDLRKRLAVSNNKMKFKVEKFCEKGEGEIYICMLI